jgi:DNA-binding XRE family transcriptional regulator
MNTPRRSGSESALAEVRHACGLTQGELAEMIGVAKISIARVEGGSLPLSAKLATKIGAELDISPDWLKQNDLRQPPITPRGGLWSKDLYEARQGKKVSLPLSGAIPMPMVSAFESTMPTPSNETDDSFVEWFRAEVDAEINAMLHGAKNTARLGILVHRIRDFLKRTAETFKPDFHAARQLQPRVEALFESYKTAVEEIGAKEHLELWGDDAVVPLAESKAPESFRTTKSSVTNQLKGKGTGERKT